MPPDPGPATPGRHGRPCSTGGSECTRGSVLPAQERVLPGLALPRRASRPRSVSWGAAVQPPRKPPASWGRPGAGQREGRRTRPAAPRPGATYPGKCLSERRARREENTRLVGDCELTHGHRPWAEEQTCRRGPVSERVPQGCGPGPELSSRLPRGDPGGRLWPLLCRARARGPRAPGRGGGRTDDSLGTRMLGLKWRNTPIWIN